MPDEPRRTRPPASTSTRCGIAGALLITPGGGWPRAERSGTGSPVVLLHGVEMDVRLWVAVGPELARNHDVVRYDARGLGSSSLPDRPVDDVEDLGAILDHFGLDRAALVGLSMGGETALDFALAHCGRVRALALVGASVSGHVWPRDPHSSAYATARRQRDATVLAALELSISASLGRTAPGAELIEGDGGGQRRTPSRQRTTLRTLAEPKR